MIVIPIFALLAAFVVYSGIRDDCNFQRTARERLSSPANAQTDPRLLCNADLLANDTGRFGDRPRRIIVIPSSCSSRPLWFILGFTTFAWSRNLSVLHAIGNATTPPFDLTNGVRPFTANGTIDRQAFPRWLERLKHRGTEVTEETLGPLFFSTSGSLTGSFDADWLDQHQTRVFPPGDKQWRTICSTLSG